MPTILCDLRVFAFLAVEVMEELYLRSVLVQVDFHNEANLQQLPLRQELPHDAEKWGPSSHKHG